MFIKYNEQVSISEIRGEWAGWATSSFGQISLLQNVRVDASCILLLLRNATCNFW